MKFKLSNPKFRINKEISQFHRYQDVKIDIKILFITVAIYAP